MSSHGDVLFQHSCSHEEENGTLSLTSRGLIWRRSDGASSISVLWTSIVPKSDKYQPSKGMIRIQDSCSKQFKIFTLLGEDSHKLARKFDLGKRFFKHNLYQEPCPIIANQSSQLLTKPSTRDLQSSSNHQSDEEFTKQSMLDNDPDLSSWYDELLQQGICDQDTFWQSRSNQLRDLEIEQKAHIKGRVNSLLSDIDHGEADIKGKKHIEMTLDSKDEIFVLYPHIQKEFAEKVPAQMTEDDFWPKYFQMQQAKYCSLHTGMQNMNDFSKVQQLKKRALQSQQLPSVFVSPYVSLDVDLTATEGDYHTRETLDPEDYNWHTSDFINEKYINKSTLIMQQHERLQQTAESDQQNSTSSSNQSTTKNKPVVGYYHLPSKKRKYLPSELDDDSTLLNNSTDDGLIPLQLTSLKTTGFAAAPGALCAGAGAKASQIPVGEVNDTGMHLFAKQVEQHSVSLIFPPKERALHLLHSNLNNVSERDSSSDLHLTSQSQSQSQSQSSREGKLATPQTVALKGQSDMFAVTGDFEVVSISVSVVFQCRLFSHSAHYSLL